jgi:hypothetical protein
MGAKKGGRMADRPHQLAASIPGNCIEYGLFLFLFPVLIEFYLEEFVREQRFFDGLAHPRIQAFLTDVNDGFELVSQPFQIFSLRTVQHKDLSQNPPGEAWFPGRLWAAARIAGDSMARRLQNVSIGGRRPFQEQEN